MKRFVVLAVAALSVCAPANASEPALCGYRIVHSYPHDPHAFTEGLFYRDGDLFESTGLEGRSTIRRVRLSDGVVVRQVAIPENLFGEGIVDWDDEIRSVTWRTGVGFRMSLAGFEPKGSFVYPGEGWGMTRDRRSIILSDGTARLRFLDPLTMREQRSITVRNGDRPVTNLNELEWVQGEILANVWQTELIARIDPSSGVVHAWIDLAGLRETTTAGGPNDVANGIAYDRSGNRLFVTGKNWSKLFEIALTDASHRPHGRRSARCPRLGGFTPSR